MLVCPNDDKGTTSNSGAVIEYSANGSIFTISEQQERLVDITKINPCV